jgi:hypothetical protein
MLQSAHTVPVWFVFCNADLRCYRTLTYILDTLTMFYLRSQCSACAHNVLASHIVDFVLELTDEKEEDAECNPVHVRSQTF